MELLIRLEAGQLDRAAEAAVELITLGEQHGFDFWALVGTAQQATVAAVSALADNADRDILQQHVAALTAFVEVSRAIGTVSLVTSYDAILARLLIASGELPKAASVCKWDWSWPNEPRCTSTTRSCCGSEPAPQATPKHAAMISKRPGNWPGVSMRQSSSYALLQIFSRSTVHRPGT